MQEFFVFGHVLCFSTRDTRKTCYIIKLLVNGNFSLVHFVMHHIYHNGRAALRELPYKFCLKTLLKMEIICKWMKIFNFTEYSKDWEQIILGSGPETRQWKGKTVKLVSIFTSQLQSCQNHC